MRAGSTSSLTVVVMIAVVAAASLCASLARAQPADPDRLIDRGVALRAQGRDADALALFEQAHAARPDGMSLAQIALAEQALGRWLEADEHLRAALAMDDRWVGRNRATLEEALSAIGQHVGQLRLTGTPAGAEIRIGERVMGALPMAEPVRVLVGRVRVDISAAGHQPLQHEVEIVGGRVTEESIQLRATAASRPSHPSSARRRRPAPGSRESRRSQETRSGGVPVLGIVGLGVAGAALGVGVVGAVLREGHASDWNSDACLEGGLTREQRCGDVRDAGARAELVSIVGFAAAGALAAGSVVLLLVGSSGSESRERAATGPSWTCSAGPGELGVACSGRF